MADRSKRPDSSHSEPPQDSGDDSRSMRRDAIDRAERTLDVQRERFDRIDEKSSKILRFTAVLSGTLFAVLGLTPASQLERSGLLNSVSGVTAVALAAAGVGFVGTVLFAAVTYVTTRFGSSFSRGALSQVNSGKIDETQYQKLLIGAYQEAIQKNRPRIARNNRQFVVTLCLLVCSITSLAVAGVTASLSLKQTTRQAVFGVAVVSYLGFLIFTVHLTTGGR